MANFIKYKDELVNLELCSSISLHYCGYDEDYLIFFDSDTSDSGITNFRFKTEKERDKYFLKIQKRIEKIQGFKIDLGDKND